MKINCAECGKEKQLPPSQVFRENFCNRSCMMTWRNKTKNPSWTRDLSGEKNPMWGKHLKAWNKGIKGEACHNWKGGLHTRKDGYVRINIGGTRKLYHRHLLETELKEKNIVHHKDHNPSNNHTSNLVVLESQSTHARLHNLKLI